MNKQEMMAYIDSQEESMMQLWENLVKIESRSQEIEGVKKMADSLEIYLDGLGLKVKKIPFENAGPSLVAYNEPKENPAIIFSDHMDTVHAKGTFGDDLFRKEGEFVHGPGVYDCKGGIVVAILVMKTLMHFGYDKRQLKLVLSGDEEVAHGMSETKSVDVYLEEAKGAGFAFNCESGILNGDVVTGRKGGGVIKVKVTGVASHAGNAPEKGCSAVREAAKKIVAIEAMSDINKMLFNCGAVKSSGSSNVIPDLCEFEVGVRFRTNDDYDEGIAKLEAIIAEQSDPRLHSEMKISGMFRAMEKVEGSDELFATWQESCEELGYRKPDEVFTGGCSDAAFISMAGVPVLCAVGVRGSDNHAKTERAVLSSLCERAKIMLNTILKLDEKGF